MKRPTHLHLVPDEFYPSTRPVREQLLVASSSWNSLVTLPTGIFFINHLSPHARTPA